jgi:hypothetical protein
MPTRRSSHHCGTGLASGAQHRCVRAEGDSRKKGIRVRNTLDGRTICREDAQPVPRDVSLITSATEIVCALGRANPLISRSHKFD